MECKGLYTALVTPFNEDTTLDREGLAALVRQQCKAGVDAIVVLGTTGESATIEPDERIAVIKIALENSTVPIWVGTGANSTRKAIEQTLEAQRLGAAGALIVSPYYNRPTQEGLYQHFKAIHDATRIPIMLYNNPGRCGVNLLPETVLRLAALERIYAIKEASGNLSQMSELLGKAPANFAVLSGDDAMALPAVILGASGLVSVLSNLHPEEVKAYVDHCLAHRIREARAAHHRWAPELRALFAETNPIIVKRKMNLMGLPAGPCRAPL